MTRLIALLLAVALLALGVTGWQWKVAKDDLTSAQRIIGTLSAGIESRDKAIARLDADARASQKREAELRLMQGRASTAALNREMTIQRETDANPILRDWSAAALPDDVIRLHTRPAFSNARDYLDWVSARDKLPGAGKQP
ncbi:LysB family phage lysis regulatory protein [Pantoea sp. Bo_2]|uniref:Rz-like lysis system protein LysB n=1 Tax=unclassified Pantoea TaxID=2630326 RepID=UPI001232E6AA|nr:MULTISPECIES: Rz-like lysis system protein LysB [unclassified Pantoea]KAA5944008.1 LysB family phage lysis regulatory protein [Pantoea sp. VH_3]KAA5951585.1 LysB family phage lysis regulatory protein [Pantoea sp. VH_25]KAA5981561.1 LysB family phage lysis regulatory protein [Pantoea sp. M_3]KAA6044585.1 LysB family phage lysis regulatory protein [Pantoea sp. FN_2b]KAA6049010.1 LysB family phage lysis regulatory protein [Pantoea sp. Bo_5]